MVAETSDWSRARGDEDVDQVVVRTDATVLRSSIWCFYGPVCRVLR